MPSDFKMPELTAEDLDLGRQLVAEGWKSISNSHRMIARLPPGMNVLEAYTWAANLGYADKHEYLKALELEHARLTAAERSQQMMFLRCTAPRIQNPPFDIHKTLPLRHYLAFKKVGGEAA